MTRRARQLLTVYCGYRFKCVFHFLPILLKPKGLPLLYYETFESSSFLDVEYGYFGKAVFIILLFQL